MKQLLQQNDILFWLNKPITAKQVSALFVDSGIHRPSQDLDRLQKMIDNASLTITAWQQSNLVGIARSLTDFSYATYLSDLAVAKHLQKSGIGKKLIELTQNQIGPQSMLLLLSAPDAVEYYPKVGFELHNAAYIIRRRV